MNDDVQGHPEPTAGEADTGRQPGSGLSGHLNDAELRARRALSELESALGDARAAAESESARRADTERQARQEIERVQDSLRVAEAAAEEARQRAERSQADVVAVESQLTQQRQVERELRTTLDDERAEHAATAEDRDRLMAEVDRLSSALAEQRDSIGRLLDELPRAEQGSSPPAPEVTMQREVPEPAPEPIAEAPEPEPEPEPVPEPVPEPELEPEPEPPSLQEEPAPEPAPAVEAEVMQPEPEPLPPPPPPPAPAPDVTRAANPVMQSTPPAGTPLPAQPPPADLDELANACLGRGERSVVSGALRRLPGRLEAGERPTHLGVGDYDGMTILVAVTDRRVLLLKLDEEMYQAFPYSQITGAEVVRERFGKTSLHIASVHGTVMVKGRRPELLERAEQHVRERIGSAQPVT